MLTLHSKILFVKQKSGKGSGFLKEDCEKANLKFPEQKRASTVSMTCMETPFCSILLSRLTFLF